VKDSGLWFRDFLKWKKSPETAYYSGLLQPFLIYEPN
jgi:hypothetical protein